jgi:autotransporter translocation and assembly factor TamB
LSFDGGRGNLKVDGFSTLLFNIGNNERNNLIEIGSTSIDVNMNNLQVTDTRAVRSNVSGRVNISDRPRQLNQQEHTQLLRLPDFSLNGLIVANEVRLNLDEFLRLSAIRTIPEPILVTAQRTQSDTLQIAKVEGIPFQLPELEFNISIDMPRNVWLQGMDMFGMDVNVELRGAGSIVRNEHDEFIEGTIEVVRGSYLFYGKRFIFEEGIVTFYGHEIDNPVLQIKANYMFRNPYGIRQRISLHIDGNLQDPEITFYIDGIQIAETDALALIIFGRGSEYLTQNEEQMVINNASELQIGLTFLIDQFSSQVSQILQNQLGVDLIEIRGDNQWQEASLTVGRYIGRNLFVSYETDFDFTGFRTMGTDRWNVEYQINRHFFITTTQGDTNENGIDLIFRWQRR